MAHLIPDGKGGLKVDPNVIGIREEQRMTREEAINIMHKFVPHATKDQCKMDINCLEALGLLKFDEDKAVTLFEFKDNNFGMGELKDKYGVVRLEEWKEGLVLWVGGQIVWKSWDKNIKKGDEVVIEQYDGTHRAGKLL